MCVPLHSLKDRNLWRMPRFLFPSRFKYKMEIKIFKHEQFGDIRTINKDGEPWFVGKDVASVLGYVFPRRALYNHVDEEDKTTVLIQHPGSNYKSKTMFINESGLYSLILSSKLPQAKEFKRWVTSEVLPSIRRNGHISRMMLWLTLPRILTMASSCSTP